MKRYVLPLLLAASASLATLSAQAQDNKPALNTTPPGPPPAPAQPVQPAPAPAYEPAPGTATPTEPGVPGVQPTSTAPSGLDFPNRADTKAGGAEDQPASRKFLYTNLGLGFSSSGGISNFNFSLAPAIGYRLTSKLAVGPGISYTYNSYSLSPQDYYNTYGHSFNTPTGNLTESGSNNLSTRSLGVKIFAQYIIYNEFFIHGEYEVTNAQLPGKDLQGYLVKINYQVTSPLAGIGYRSKLGDRAAVDILGLYNFNSSVFSLYPGLNLRFCFLFDIGK